MRDDHDPDGVLLEREGRSALRFERLLGHPAERVWRALTERGELAGWHPSPFELQPAAPGGTVVYPNGVGGFEMRDGEVTDYDPPRLLGHTWGEDHLRWELHERDGSAGCLLILTHTFEDHFKSARDAAGWHLCLRALSTLLDVGPASADSSEPRLPGGWRELNSAYEERFGIPPEQATPPPPR
jgi:uncharacterized protein YndB with AHSA1/START domain